MGVEAYRLAIARFCAEAEIMEIETVIRDGLVDFDGTMVRLEYMESVDYCRVQIDLEAPRGGFSDAFCRLMLESNVINTSDCLPALALDPETGHALLLLHMPVARLCSDINLYEVLAGQIDSLREEWDALLAKSTSGRPVAWAGESLATSARSIP